MSCTDVSCYSNPQRTYYHCDKHVQYLTCYQVVDIRNKFVYISACRHIRWKIQMPNIETLYIVNGNMKKISKLPMLKVIKSNINSMSSKFTLLHNLPNLHRAELCNFYVDSSTVINLRFIHCGRITRHLACLPATHYYIHTSIDDNDVVSELWKKRFFWSENLFLKRESTNHRLARRTVHQWRRFLVQRLFRSKTSRVTARIISSFV